MNRKEFDVAATLVERMDKLEKTIFGLEEIKDMKIYKITASDAPLGYASTNSEYKILEVNLNPNEIATEVFIQNILQYYIDNLNLELNELRKDFEEI